MTKPWWFWLPVLCPRGAAALVQGKLSLDCSEPWTAGVRMLGQTLSPLHSVLCSHWRAPRSLVLTNAPQLCRHHCKGAQNTLICSGASGNTYDPLIQNASSSDCNFLPYFFVVCLQLHFLIFFLFFLYSCNAILMASFRNCGVLCNILSFSV